MYKSFLFWSLFLALMFSSISEREAYAQRAADIERKITVLGFDAEKNLYLVKIKSGSFDTVYMVRDMDTQKRVDHVKAGSKQEEKKAIKRLKRKHKIIDLGVEGQVSPDEAFTVIGVPSKDKKIYRILVMEGGRIGQLARIELRSVVEEEETKYATGMVKQVRWSEDGRLLLVVLTEKLITETVSEESDREMVIWFRRWKIKWLPPPNLPKPAKP